MQTMTITRGLTELKRLNSRIENVISQGKYVAATQGANKFKKVIGSADSVEAMTSKIQASFDAVDSLIANRQAIKSAIVLSNANTYVTLLGRSMTVAEAIELKSTVNYRKLYLSTLRTQFIKTTSEVDKFNTQLDVTIETLLSTVYGSDKSKVSAESYQMVAGPQKEQKQCELLDPQKIESRVAKLTEEISVIEAELDIVLSESNAKTVIDV